MTRRVTIKVNDRAVEGTDTHFEPLSEHWNEYRLEDGSLVRVRALVSNIIVTSESNEVGDPLIAVKSKTLVSYHPAPEDENDA